MSADATIQWTDPARERAFAAWLAIQQATHGLDPQSLRAASSDASFRRYFRADAATRTWIVMDAPPAQEDNPAFARMARLLSDAGMRVPEVHAWDVDHGFLLLDDLGRTTMLDALHGRDAMAAAPLYLSALDALVQLQSIPVPPSLPRYDAPMLERELAVFTEWYVERHCRHVLTAAQKRHWDNSAALIVAACLEQPQVLVHRDYHARNLMASADGDTAPPGLLDFQGAVCGPITYDLASLLRDAYIAWPEEVQLDWAVRWWERARKADLPVDPDFGAVWRAFEWTGLQRHLKVLGIFARLSQRDGKHGYLADLPRVWQHAHRVCLRYRALGPLAQLLEQLGGVQREAGYTF